MSINSDNVEKYLGTRKYHQICSSRMKLALLMDLHGLQLVAIMPRINS